MRVAEIARHAEDLGERLSGWRVFVERGQRAGAEFLSDVGREQVGAAVNRVNGLAEWANRRETVR